MSLLMDALKKAEEEKKKAAEAGQALSLDDATLVQEPQEQPSTPAYEDTHTQSGEHGDTVPEGEGLSLEPLAATGEDAGFASEPGPSDGDIHDRTETLSPEEQAEMLAEFEHTGTLSGEHTGEGTGTYDGDETVPSERTIHSSLKDYFEASQSINSTTLSGVHTRAEEVEQAETGVPETTHVTAQTVFTAGAGGRKGSTFVWVGSAIILLLLLGGGGAWYYLELMPGAGQGSPAMAKLNPRPAPPVPVPESRPQPQAAAVVAAQPAPPAMNPPEAAMAMPAQPAMPAPAPVPAASDLGPVEPPAYARLDQTVVVPQEQTAPAPAPAPAPTATVAASAPVPALEAQPPAPPVQLKIRKARSSKRLDKGLKQAYAAYQSGDTASAARLYREVLKRRPRQRDALLGLAAIALAQGDREAAWLRYREVLRNNPGDPVASAALFSISGGAEGGPVSASRLKLLLDRYPRAAYLHFALGGVYARQQRWSEAQQSFFEAYSSDSNNPDYAYNLAVSLDHLSQPKAALDYYHKAMALAGQGPAGFNTARVLARIQALSALKNPS